MNENTHIQIKQLAGQMKCQQAWQTVPSKKGKKVAESSETKKEVSTEAKVFSTEKTVPTGTSSLPTTTSSLPATISSLSAAPTCLETATPTGEKKVLHNLSKIIAQRRVNTKPFATTISQELV